MSDDQFTKLFTYMEKRFDGIDARFERVEHDIAGIRSTVAELSARVETYHQEVIVLAHQFDQLRREVRHR